MAKSDKILKRKVRNSYIISTISIAMVLFLLGSVGYLILNALRTTNQMRENVTVYVMLNNDTDEMRRDSIGVMLRANPAVKEALFVSKQEAAADFKEYIDSDFEEFLEFNPLPDSYEVKMNADYSGHEAVVVLDEEVAAWSGVEEVVYQKNVIDQIGSNITLFNIILLIFGGTLLVISLILLNNTLRLTIYSKRYLINTMKMVGASKWFIMRPFVGRSLLHGFYAWIIGGIMFIGMVAALGRGLPEVTFLADNRPIGIILGLMLLLGLLISVLFTIFAVNKFVNMHSSKIHLY
jgi:cell division transport system permease protein